MTTKENDPLEGFRGRNRDAAGEIEEEVRAWRALATDDINLSLLQDIIKADNLLEEMEHASSPLKRLVTYASQRIGESCALWVQSTDPAAPKIVAAHRDARAARLLLDWVDEQIKLGREAEKQIMLNEDESYG